MKCLVCSLDNCQEQECRDTLEAIQRLLDAMPGLDEKRVVINRSQLIEPEDLKDEDQ